MDAAFRAELARRIGPFGRLDVRQMDVVYCDSVLQHVPEPRRVLSEIRRVLAPGGLFLGEWHLYTSVTGWLDPRVTAGGDGVPPWAHLRAAHAAGLAPSAYVNRLRLPEWRALLDETLPGARVELRSSDRSLLEQPARDLRASGELAEYELDELLTQSVSCVWRRPPVDESFAS